MEFEFSDEQRQLHEAVSGFLGKELSFDRLRALKRSEPATIRRSWRGLAETSASLPSTFRPRSAASAIGPHGNAGVDGCVRPGAAARAGVSAAPVTATALLQRIRGDPGCAGSAQRHGAGRTHCGAGARRTRFALRNPDVVRARNAAGEAYRLDGHKAVVLMRGLADTLLVSARTAGEAADRSGRDAVSGATRRRRDYGSSDIPPSTASAPPRCICRTFAPRGRSASRHSGRGAPAIEAAFDIGLAALCAEAVGIMQALLMQP